MKVQGFTENPRLMFLYQREHTQPDLDAALFDGDHAQLLKSFHYIDKKLRKHTAPKGMVTDGGSIPKRMWRRLTSPFRQLLPAYLIHDHYCQRARDVEDGKLRRKLRKDADKLLAEMIAWITKNLPMVRIKRRSKALIYAGVRFGATAEEVKRLFGKKIDTSPH